MNAALTDSLRVGADIGYIDAHSTSDVYNFSGGSQPGNPDDTLLLDKTDPFHLVAARAAAPHGRTDAYVLDEIAEN